MTSAIDSLLNDTLALIVLQATTITGLAVLIASACRQRAALISCVHLAAMLSALVGPVALLVSS